MASQRRGVAQTSDELAPRRRKRAPASTPEARENQLISLAYDLVEKKLQEGTASSQETTHFLKLGSSREKLEREKLQMEIELAEKKKEVMATASRAEEMMEAAIAAFRSYSGNPEIDESEQY